MTKVASACNTWGYLLPSINVQFPADLVTFTEEILNEKLHFMCSVLTLLKLLLLRDKVILCQWSFCRNDQEIVVVYIQFFNVPPLPSIGPVFITSFTVTSGYIKRRVGGRQQFEDKSWAKLSTRTATQYYCINR